MAGFVRMNRGVRIDVGVHQGDVLRFGLGDERQRPTIAFAHDHNDLALACLVFGLAAVAAVFLFVRRLHIAAEIGTINFDLVERLAQLGIDEKEVNVRNKLSRGKFTAAYFLQCLEAIGVSFLSLQ